MRGQRLHLICAVQDLCERHVRIDRIGRITREQRSKALLGARAPSESMINDGDLQSRLRILWIDAQRPLEVFVSIAKSTEGERRAPSSPWPLTTSLLTIHRSLGQYQCRSETALTHQRIELVGGVRHSLARSRMEKDLELLKGE